MSGSITAVDLFCGAGGFSTGLALACEDLGQTLGEDVELHAINHWGVAIETHEQNHPWAEHYHAKIEKLHPPNVVEPGTVDLLVGGPECTHFSSARGGKPSTEQQRASPWHVLDWVEKLRPEHILLENVKEFRLWGPLDEDGQPTRDGSIFEQWVGMLEALGYTVDHRVLNAADYGDPTSRRRLFVAASRTKRPTYPDPTHAEEPSEDQEPWRTAAEIIDWDDLGGSVFTRDLEKPRVQPLSQNTMARVAEGIRRHCDDRLSVFADALEAIGPDVLRDLRDRIVPVEYAHLAAEVLDEPFLVHSPAAERTCLTSPYVLRQQSGGVPAAVTETPLPTISGAGAIGLASPVTRPLIEPKLGRSRGVHSNPLNPAADQPIHTITADPRAKVVTPQLVHYSHGGSTRDVTDLMPTIATERGGAFGLATPFFVEYYGQSDSAPVDAPLPTVTTKDRHALCVPEAWPWGLDVRYRMLQPDELKRAQGFPADYDLAGETKKAVTKQIGNAVPVHLASALCKHLLVSENPSLSTYGGGIQPSPDVEVPSYEEVTATDD
ncbi:DNA cytosine methyltransferase [Halobacteriales archaeon Cl-PHB]